MRTAIFKPMMEEWHDQECQSRKLKGGIKLLAISSKRIFNTLSFNPAVLRLSASDFNY